MKGTDSKEIIIGNLTQIEDTGEWKTYELNNKLKIFNKSPAGEQPLQVTIYKNYILSENMVRINNHIKWLAGGFKNDLIDFYNSQNNGNKADDNWYNVLEIYCVSIRIEKDGKITSYIDCGDNVYKTDDIYIFSVDTEDEKIMELNYFG
ncbi:MAG: hypothetical protein LBK13_08610 [Spirochaetales bacterium]|jgi:hypothetical protein|nr:hypothetical protein [Spirochaetales bacterium]